MREVLQVHHGDIVEFSTLGYALHFQLGLVAFIVGIIMWRRLGTVPLTIRLLLLGSCAVFLWPLSFYDGTAAWKAGAPCLAITLAALVPTATHRVRERHSLIAIVLVLAGVASASLMLFNDVFF